MNDDVVWWYRYQSAVEQEFEARKRQAGFYGDPEVKIRDIDRA